MGDLKGKKVKVGYSILDIEEHTPQFKEKVMNDLYGQFVCRENKIEIQSNLPNVDEANVLIHEILHACAWVSSLTQDGQPLADSEDEEVVINSLTNHFIQVLMDNEWLMPYLIKKLHY